MSRAIMDPMFNYSPFQQRRLRLAQQITRGVAIVCTAPERTRNRDTHHPYRFDSYFYHLTGFTEPEAVLLIVAGDKPRHLLFCRDKNLDREIWDGFRFGPQAAQVHFGFDEAYSIDQLDTIVPDLLVDQPAVFTHLGADTDWDSRVWHWINTVRNRARSGVHAPRDVIDVHTLLDEMRLFKDPHELELMRKAALISSGAHERAMMTTRPGLTEYAIEAELLHEFRRWGAQAPAYPSIVASGANACVLHYINNNAPLKEGDLLLIDAGCEVDGYASDITRTFPINGRFNAAQKTLYNLVLAAQSAAIAQVKPGQSWNAPHEAAVRVLTQGFIDLDLLQGSVDEAIEKQTYQNFYMHRTGHWLGLDVHDAGDYKPEGQWRPLAPGMVLTVEPGCYIRPGPKIPPELENIGIRIEDDVLVTESGHEVLTTCAKTIEQIETLMAAPRH